MGHHVLRRSVVKKDYRAASARPSMPKNWAVSSVQEKSTKVEGVKLAAHLSRACAHQFSVILRCPIAPQVLLTLFLTTACCPDQPAFRHLMSSAGSTGLKNTL